jgi:hypothetical protein
MLSPIPRSSQTFLTAARDLPDHDRLGNGKARMVITALVIREQIDFR